METFTKKDWQDFVEGKIAVNCKTEELAREFINGEKIKKIADWNGNTYWNHYKENMTYSKISKLGFCDKGYYVNQGLIIKEFKGWNVFEGIEGIEEREVKPKSPLGVMPQIIYEELRIKDLCRAIYERSQFKLESEDIDLMDNWISELKDRLIKLSWLR
jgi:hypothetical protein